MNDAVCTGAEGNGIYSIFSFFVSTFYVLSINNDDISSISYHFSKSYVTLNIYS